MASADEPVEVDGGAVTGDDESLCIGNGDLCGVRVLNDAFAGDFAPCSVS